MYCCIFPTTSKSPLLPNSFKLYIDTNTTGSPLSQPNRPVDNFAIFFCVTMTASEKNELVNVQRSTDDTTCLLELQMSSFYVSLLLSRNCFQLSCSKRWMEKNMTSSKLIEVYWLVKVLHNWYIHPFTSPGGWKCSSSAGSFGVRSGNHSQKYTHKLTEHWELFRGSVSWPWSLWHPEHKNRDSNKQSSSQRTTQCTLWARAVQNKCH